MWNLKLSFVWLAGLGFSGITWAGAGKEPVGSKPEKVAPVDIPKASALKSASLSERSNYRQIQDPADGTELFNRAKSLEISRQATEATVLYRQYLTKFPRGQYADQVSMSMGLQSFNANDFESALPYFGNVISLDPPSALRGQASAYQARANALLGRRRMALDILAKLNIQEIPKPERQELFSSWGRIATDEARVLEASLAYMRAWLETQPGARKLEIEQIVLGFVRDRLNEGELDFLLREYPEGFPSANVRLRLASQKLANGQREAARQLLTYVVNTQPANSAVASEARAMLLRLNAVEVVSSSKIGVLLPLAGAQQSIGTSVVAGLQLAFEELGQSRLEIVQVDAGPTVESAMQGFERLIFQERVMTVVGPFNGPQAEALAIKSASLGVPFISLSPRDTVLQKGASIFRFALTPEKQVRALVSYAMERMNAKRFAILFPEDAFGREFAKAYFELVPKMGGEVKAAESYSPEQSDFKVAIENMIGVGFPAFRKTEREQRLKLFEASLDHKPNRKEIESVQDMPPIVDFDVMFIPDTFRALGQIVPSLLYADVRGPKLLGPSSWHNSQLLMRAGQYLDNALFVDIFAPEGGNEITQKFVDRYQLKSGSVPTSFAAMGYDIGQGLKKAYQMGAIDNREDLRNRLEKMGVVQGALGTQNWDARRDPISEVQLFMIRRGAFQHQTRLSVE